jgi:dihydroflavonol-4-reductase
MKVLITGATGLLGNNVLRAFLDQGHSAAVIVRANSDSRPLDGLDVEKFYADLATDADEGGKVLREALDNVDVMVHCAGVIQIGWSRMDLSMKVNRDATQAIAETCRIKKIRLIHISTVDALAPASAESPGTEDQVDPAKVPTSYVVSKRAGDAVVWDEIAKGLDGVIVHPGLMFGPWDWKPSSGEMMTAIAKQFIPFAPSGGISACDVRDVAAGILSAASHAKAGQSYILAGHNISYLELWRQIAKLLQRKPPFGKLPTWLGRVVGGISDFVSRFTKSEAQSNSGGIKMGEAYNWYSSEKAAKELGYQIGPLDVALEDAYSWFKTYGYLK